MNKLTPLGALAFSFRLLKEPFFFWVISFAVLSLGTERTYVSLWREVHSLLLKLPFLGAYSGPIFPKSYVEGGLLILFPVQGCAQAPTLEPSDKHEDTAS